jgi:predicted transcriptional regulator
MSLYQVLLSINPEHVESIFHGTKRFEFRKVRCKYDIDRIIIYATSPVKRVVGEVNVSGIIEGDLESIWELTCEFAGISHSSYENYFKGKKKVVAYKLGTVQKYKEPKLLSDYGLSFAPQSFVYLKNNIVVLKN